MTSPTIINLNPQELHQRLLHYLFIVSLDFCNGSCNAFTDLTYKLCVPNKS